MKYYIFIDQNTSNITQVIHETVHFTPGTVVNNCNIVEYISDLSAIDILDNYYYKNSTLILKPSSPSEYHSWNIDTEQYEITEESLNSLRNAKLLELKQKFEVLNTSMIQIDSYFYDADSTAIKNINGKLVELSFKESLGISIDANTLFWKDALNNLRTWGTVNSYVTFLQRLAIAISDRTTSLYVKLWIKKSELEALTEVDLIVNYPINTGWN